MELDVRAIPLGRGTPRSSASLTPWPPARASSSSTTTTPSPSTTSSWPSARARWTGPIWRRVRRYGGCGSGRSSPPRDEGGGGPKALAPPPRGPGGGEPRLPEAQKPPPPPHHAQPGHRGPGGEDRRPGAGGARGKAQPGPGGGGQAPWGQGGGEPPRHPAPSLACRPRGLPPGRAAHPGRRRGALPEHHGCRQGGGPGGEARAGGAL